MALKELEDEFVRVPPYKKIYEVEQQKLIEIKDIFTSNSMVITPRSKTAHKIMILGRAGIGKTTLCKKIVYEFFEKNKNTHEQQSKNGMWNDKFDWLLWIPLRNLKKYPQRNDPYTLGDMFYLEFFLSKPNGRNLAEKLWQIVLENSGRVLFLLDGWDEISFDKEHSPISQLLKDLINQTYVIVTSRPYSNYSLDKDYFDIELETIGFNQQNVQDYLDKILTKDPIIKKEIEEFIHTNPIAIGLVNIPLQLDILCYSWNLLKRYLKENQSITMTSLYQALVDKLWLKYINRPETKQRLEKDGRFKEWLKSIDDLESFQIMEMVKHENEYLEYLAYRGMQKDTIIFDFQCLKETVSSYEEGLKANIHILKEAKQTGFITTLDSYNDQNKNDYYFLHLTFQEYLAAQYISKHFDKNKQFISHERYNKRYQYVWWFLAGFLKDSSEINQFFGLLLNEPRAAGSIYDFLLISRCLEECQLSPHVKCCHEFLNEFTVLIKKAFTPNNILWPLRRLYIACLRLNFNVASYCPPDGQSLLGLLISFYQNKDPTIRREAIVALGELGIVNSQVTQVLIQATQDTEAKVRWSAISAFRYPGIPEPPQITAHADVFEEVKRLFVNNLGRSDIFNQSSFIAINQVLDNIEIGLRKNIIYIQTPKMHKCEDIIKSLSRIFFDTQATLQSKIYVIKAIGELGSDNENAVLTLLSGLKINDQTAEIRHEILAALGNANVRQARIITALQNELENPNLSIRIISAISLIRLKAENHQQIIDALKPALRNQDKRIRMNAVAALCQLQLNYPSAIKINFADALIQALKDNDVSIRLNAAMIASQLVSASDILVEALFDTLKDNEERIRAFSAQAIVKFAAENQKIYAKLRNALNSTNTLLRSGTIAALAQIPNQSEKNIDLVRQALFYDKDLGVRLTAIFFLWQTKKYQEDVKNEVIFLLKHKDINIKNNTLNWIGQHHIIHSGFKNILFDLLKCDNNQVKLQAILILSNCYVDFFKINELLLLLESNNIEIKRNSILFLSKGNLQNHLSIRNAIFDCLGDSEVIIRETAIFNIDFSNLIEHIFKNKLIDLLELLAKRIIRERQLIYLQNNQICWYQQNRLYTFPSIGIEYLFEKMQSYIRKSIGLNHLTNSDLDNLHKNSDENEIKTQPSLKCNGF